MYELRVWRSAAVLHEQDDAGAEESMRGALYVLAVGEVDAEAAATVTRPKGEKVFVAVDAAGGDVAEAAA